MKKVNIGVCFVWTLTILLVSTIIWIQLGSFGHAGGFESRGSGQFLAFVVLPWLIVALLVILIRFLVWKFAEQEGPIMKRTAVVAPLWIGSWSIFLLTMSLYQA